MSKAEAGKACPICGGAAVEAFRPFCSRRCADVDLHRWLGGVYRVETEETGDNLAEGEGFSAPGA